MKCQKCLSKLDFCNDDDEIVCQRCGATYCLEYLGYYPEGSNDRIDEGFEEETWKEEVKEIRSYNVMKDI